MDHDPRCRGDDTDLVWYCSGCGNREHATEVEVRLVQVTGALRTYGRHKSDCTTLEVSVHQCGLICLDPHRTRCDCGLDTALGGTP